MTAPEGAETQTPPPPAGTAAAEAPPTGPSTISPGQPAWEHAAEGLPNLDDIVIEDGAPVDGILSERQMRLLTEPLYSSWDGPETGEDFVALANVGLFHTAGQPPLVPDVLLSLDETQPEDLSLKQNNSYFVWLRGKVPDLVAEIVSNREGGEDTHKLRAYARLHILYYVIFDPLNLLEGGSLRVFALRDRHYAPIAADWLEGIGLGLKLWHGPYQGVTTTWLRWCDKNGQLIPTGEEKAQQEERRAEQEKQRAEQEKQRAERAEERARRLEAKLRAQGIEPEANGP